MFNVKDIWITILAYCEYADYKNFRAVNKDSVTLFRDQSIYDLVQLKYQEYQREIKESLVNFIGGLDLNWDENIYFTVKNTHFKLYEYNMQNGEYVFQEEYQADLHYNFKCAEFIQDAFITPTPEPKLSILIAHSSPFNQNPNYANKKHINIQIESQQSKYLVKYGNGWYTTDIYNARKYPEERNPDWSDDEFSDDSRGPLETFWPTDLQQQKSYTVDEFNIMTSNFPKFLSKTYNNVEQYWILTTRDLSETIVGLDSLIISNEIIQSEDEDYYLLKIDTKKILKFAKI